MFVSEAGLCSYFANFPRKMRRKYFFFFRKEPPDDFSEITALRVKSNWSPEGLSSTGNGLS